VIVFCSKCHESKDESLFYVRKDTGRLRKECKTCFNAKTLAWQANNRDKVRGYVRKSCKKAYDANPAKFKEKSKEKRANNPQKAREIVKKSYMKTYYSRHAQERARLNNLSASRRTATPNWLSAIEKAMIQEFYDVAQAKTVQTGIKHHVDHIMPINGANSCGLHVPWNMQILTASENCGKKNKVVEL
jgi:hypothetical protein